MMGLNTRSNQPIICHVGVSCRSIMHARAWSRLHQGDVDELDRAPLDGWPPLVLVGGVERLVDGHRPAVTPGDDDPDLAWDLLPRQLGDHSSASARIRDWAMTVPAPFLNWTLSEYGPSSPSPTSSSRWTRSTPS